jgi:RNA polymerase sigma factor (sigma-70 family)
MDSTPTFEDIYRRHAKGLYNFVCYQIGDVYAADDIVASTFERVLRSLRTYDPRRGSHALWVYAIARNAIKDYRRTQRRRKTTPSGSLEHTASTESTPEDRLVLDDSAQRLMRTVAGLAARDREIIGLKFSAGLTNKAISRTIGIREGNVAVALHRAVRRLRERLKKEEAS